MLFEVKSRIEDPELIARRRKQIVAAATALFGRKGFHRTTIRDIAGRAGISTGLIYEYVRDKDDVLFLALLEVLEAYRREVPKALYGLDDPLARLIAAADAYCRVVDRNIAATLLAYRETASLPPARREQIKACELETNDLIAACVRDCVKAGDLRKVNVEVMTYQIVMLAHGWALKHWRLGKLMTLEQYVADGLALLLDPALTRRGRRRHARLAGARAPEP